MRCGVKACLSLLWQRQWLQVTVVAPCATPEARRGVIAAPLPSRGGRNNPAGKAGSEDSGGSSCAIQPTCSGNDCLLTRSLGMVCSLFLPAMSSVLGSFPSQKAQNSQIPHVHCQGMQPGPGAAAIFRFLPTKASVPKLHGWGGCLWL